LRYLYHKEPLINKGLYFHDLAHAIPVGKGKKEIRVGNVRLAKRLAHGFHGEGLHVVLIAQMCEHRAAHARGVQANERLGAGIVGEVPLRSQYAPLEGIGVMPGPSTYPHRDWIRSSRARCPRRRQTDRR